MNTAELIQKITDLITNAKQEDAIKLLVDHLNQDARYKALYNQALQVQSEFGLGQSKILDGVLSDDQVNAQFARINKKIVAILDKLEKGDLSGDSVSNGSSSSRGLVVGLVTAAILGLSAVVYFVFLSKKEDPKTVVTQTSNCPNVDQKSNFNILLLPFDKLAGDDIHPEFRIRNEINNLCARNKIDASATCTLSDSFRVQNINEANDLGRHCGAEMVIWGEYEKSGDSTLISLNYKITKEDFFQVQNLKLEGESGIKAVKTLSSIQTGGELLSGVENTILLIFGLIAYNNEDYQNAANALTQATAGAQTPQDTLIHRLIADSYINLNQPDQAIEQYNKYYEKGGTAKEPLKNRALLKCAKGDFAGTLEDLNTAQAKDPKDTTLLWASVYAHGKMGDYDEQLKDLNKIKEIKPESQRVKIETTRVQSKIIEEKARKVKTEQTIEQNPNDRSALIQNAVAEQRLGNTDKSVSTLETVLQKDPNNKEASAAYLRALESNGQTEKAKIFRQTAIKNKILTEKDLTKDAPRLLIPVKVIKQ